MTKVLSSHLREDFDSDFDCIDGRLRGSTIIESILRVVDKEFSPAANYLKEYGELFRRRIEIHHPRVTLFHVYKYQDPDKTYVLKSKILDRTFK